MNWVDVLGGLLAYDVVEDIRQQRREAKLVAAGWIPPERLPAVGEAAWQGTEEVMIDSFNAALAAANAALPNGVAAADRVMILWARGAIPRLARLHRTFGDLLVSSGAGPGNFAYDLLQDASLTISAYWLPGAQRMANATGPHDVTEEIATMMRGRRSWTELQRRMGVDVGPPSR